MAWTLYLLVGITVATASAMKCNKFGASNPDQDTRQQYYSPVDNTPGTHARIYDHMNTRSADIVPSAYLANVPKEAMRPQFGLEEINRRSDSGSKVLSWKPYAETRRGQINDKIVFPGPITKKVPIQVPEQCKKIGICEDIPNYPREQVKAVIAKISNRSMFENDKLDIPEVPDITQRVGAEEENIELCEFDSKVVHPKAAVDSKGEWHVVLNDDEIPLQGYKVEICKKDTGPCSAIATFQIGYEGRCVQKFVYRKMAVYENGGQVIKSLKVPSCCSCVARTSIN